MSGDIKTSFLAFVKKKFSQIGCFPAMGENGLKSVQSVPLEMVKKNHVDCRGRNVTEAHEFSLIVIYSGALPLLAISDPNRRNSAILFFTSLSKHDIR